MKKNSFYFSFLLFLLFWNGHFLYAQNSKFTVKGDTLVLENDLFARTFLLKQGHLHTISLENKQSGHQWVMTKAAPDFTIADADLNVSDTEFDTATRVATSLTPAHFRLQFITDYGSFSLKRIYRLYNDIAMMKMECYVKGQWPMVKKQSAESRSTGVENLPAESPKANTVIEHLSLPGRHWKIEVASFQDETDSHNTLVQRDDYILYRKPLTLEGNLLMARDQISGEHLIWLKESPMGESQLAYPGYDFQLSYNDWTMSGIGVTPGQQFDKWTRVYGSALGLSAGSELDKLTTLRHYLKNQRTHQPERDEMIMMNTWGDRGQDGKMREEFALAELEAASKLGITHLQLDDGWQAGLSKNSASSTGELWDAWPKESWQAHPDRFPNGLQPVIDKAQELDIKLGLWFHPSNANDYQQWQQDAEVLIDLHQKYGINTFKIDGIELPNKQSEINLRNLFDTVRQVSNGKVIFNLDATAGRRGGYFYLNEYGNIFLENRYTDWANYYPYQTLSNLWMLSRYIPPENLQMEFLNKWRNADKYPENDPFAPANYSFDYLFAITMPAQPLAWFEGSNLPDEAFVAAELVEKYGEIMADFHKGTILPIGEEPDGKSWTGFQSITNESEGYLLILREANPDEEALVDTFLPENTQIRLIDVYEDEKSKTETLINNSLGVKLTAPNIFVLYKYALE